jgi:hypothetical protein
MCKTIQLTGMSMFMIMIIIKTSLGWMVAPPGCADAQIIKANVPAAQERTSHHLRGEIAAERIGFC